MANEQMTRYWKEDGGPRWVENTGLFDTMLTEAERLLLDAARPAAGERVLDIGCGFGTTTLEMASAVGPSGEVTGVDLSDAMVERLRERAGEAGASNVRGLVADVQTAELQGGAFDLAVSRMGVMFFDNPVAAFANVRRALAPSGRLVFVCWRSPLENQWVSVVIGAVLSAGATMEPPVPGAPGPFSFADADRVREILADAGYRDVAVEPADGRVTMGAGEGLGAAVRHASITGEARRVLDGLDQADRERALGAVREAMAPLMDDGAVRMGAAYWVVTARA
jgi:SAM-dependent methyltransferase